MNVIVLKAALDFVRGIVRPVSLMAVVGAVIAFLAQGMLEEAKFMAAFGGPILGWWFAERHRNGQ